MAEDFRRRDLSDAQRALFRLSPDDRVLQFAALTFDASIFEIVMALSSGGLAQQSKAPNPAATATSIDKIYEPFLGKWTGELEYRDFQTNERVQLPTWLDVRLSPDGSLDR